MATIFERYPGRWYMKYRQNGKQILKAAGSTKSEAKACLKKFNEIKSIRKLTEAGLIAPANSKPKAQKMTFSELAVHYADHCATKAPRTELNEIQRINAHFLPIFGDLTLDEITPDKIEKWKQKRMKKNISSKTLYNDLRVLKTMFNRAIDWDFFDGKNPVGKLPKTYNRQLTILTSETAQAYLQACPKYYYPIAATLICTGIRTGELLDLKWSDIDFDDEVIRIRPTSSLKNEEGRSIPIFPDLLPILQSQPRTSEYVFPGEDGVAKRVHFRRGHDKARKAIGMTKLRIHDLRHTFITLLLEKGFDIASVSKLVGHKSIKITLNIYHHLHQEHARTIIDGLPINLDKPSQKTDVHEKSGI